MCLVSHEEDSINLQKPFLFFHWELKNDNKNERPTADSARDFVDTIVFTYTAEMLKYFKWIAMHTPSLLLSLVGLKSIISLHMAMLRLTLLADVSSVNWKHDRLELFQPNRQVEQLTLCITAYTTVSG